MAHVRVQRLGTGHAQKYTPQHQESLVTVAQQVAHAEQRIEAGENHRVPGNSPDSQHADGQKPKRHDRAEGAPDPRSSHGLYREQQQQDDHRGRQYVSTQRRYRDVQSLERRQHRNRRRDGAITVDERGTEQPDRDDERPLVLLDRQQRHEGENAALAVVVDAHGDADVLDRS